MDGNPKMLLASVAALRSKLAQRVKERDRTNMQIMEIEKNLRNLEVFLFKNAVADKRKPPAQVGITEAVCMVLRQSADPIMSPADVKQALGFIGFDLNRLGKNPSATIHNTLIRLERQGQVNAVKDSHGRTKAYFLIRQAEVPYVDASGGLK
jgi:hypothetical protein